MAIRTGDVEEVLRRAGAAHDTAARVWRMGDLRLTVDDAWLTARAPTTRRAVRVGPALFRGPGLWKDAPRGDRVERVADLPLRALVGAEDGDDEAVDDTALLAWLRATRSGRSSTLPSLDADTVVAALPENAATLRAGNTIARPRVVTDGGRTIVRVDIGRTDAALPAARHDHLQRLLADAARLRMVRAGWRRAGDDGLVVVLEIDLTGAPTTTVPGLLAEAAWVLQWAFGWLTEAVTLLLDTATTTRILDDPPIAACATA